MRASGHAQQDALRSFGRRGQARPSPARRGKRELRQPEHGGVHQIRAFTHKQQKRKEACAAHHERPQEIVSRAHPSISSSAFFTDIPSRIPTSSAHVVNAFILALKKSSNVFTPATKAATSPNFSAESLLMYPQAT